MNRRTRWRVASIFTGGLAAVTISPWVTTIRTRAATVARALMPWASLLGLPVAVVAVLGRRRVLAAGAVGVAGAGVAMARPLTRDRRRPRHPNAPVTTIAHANLLYNNRRIDDAAVALSALDVDVLTFSEYTPAHAANLASSPLLTAWTHRIERPAELASGTALFSRHPLDERATIADTRHHTVVADVHAPAGTLRVAVIHTQSPMVRHARWAADLAYLARVEPEGPAVMIGDFNAGWWHPELRRLMGRRWRDAHHVVGRGLSASWPVGHWLLPPFVRLDHALVTAELDVVAVADFYVPGSDHRGVIVTVGPAR